MKVFPILLNNLNGQRCVVIGGNHEAERKAGDLLACDADVEVIAPEVTETLAEWADEGRLKWHPRAYRPGDLSDTFLVIISETNPERTAPIWEEAQAEKVLINAMDDVQHCTFVAGSVVRRGPLVITISTSGCAPALSVRLRERMEETYGPEYGHFLELMRDLRPPMAAHYPDFVERRRRWYAIVDSDVLDLLKEGPSERVFKRLAELVGEDVAQAVQPAHV